MTKKADSKKPAKKLAVKKQTVKDLDVDSARAKKIKAGGQDTTKCHSALIRTACQC